MALKTQPNKQELAAYVSENFPILDLVVSEDDIDEGSLTVLRHFLPLWSTSNLTLKKYTDGITNKLYKVVVEDEKRQYSVLLRIYGKNTEKLIDREQELQSMVFLSQYGLSSPLVGRFQNGMCYGYIAGRTFTPDDMVAKTKWPKVAKHLAYFHSVSHAGPEVEPSLFVTLEKWIALLPADKSDIKDEYKRLKKAILKNLKKRKPVIAFCHNDLLSANIIYRPSSLAVSPESKPVVSLNSSFSIHPRVAFIDVEYSSFNYTSFDIANHICEMMGYLVEASRFPSVEFQKEWLRVYLGHWKNLMNLKSEGKLPERALQYEGEPLPVTDEEVNLLYGEVAPFTLAAHFLWGTWAVIQSTLSDRDDFDYKDYSSRLYTIYYQRKKEIFPKFPK